MHLRRGTRRRIRFALGFRRDTSRLDGDGCESEKEGTRSRRGMVLRTVYARRRSFNSVCPIHPSRYAIDRRGRDPHPGVLGRPCAKEVRYWGRYFQTLSRAIGKIFPLSSNKHHVRFLCPSTILAEEIVRNRRLLSERRMLGFGTHPDRSTKPQQPSDKRTTTRSVRRMRRACRYSTRCRNERTRVESVRSTPAPPNPPVVLACVPTIAYRTRSSRGSNEDLRSCSPTPACGWWFVPWNSSSWRNHAWDPYETKKKSTWIFVGWNTSRTWERKTNPTCLCSTDVAVHATFLRTRNGAYGREAWVALPFMGAWNCTCRPSYGVAHGFVQPPFRHGTPCLG